MSGGSHRSAGRLQRACSHVVAGAARVPEDEWISDYEMATLTPADAADCVGILLGGAQFAEVRAKGKAPRARSPVVVHRPPGLPPPQHSYIYLKVAYMSAPAV